MSSTVNLVLVGVKCVADFLLNVICKTEFSMKDNYSCQLRRFLGFQPRSKKRYKKTHTGARIMRSETI